MACLDRSANVQHVMKQAAAIAALSGARLSIIRVVPKDGMATPCADPVEWELMKREQQANLLQVSQAAGATGDTEAIVKCGDACDVICEQAIRSGADLIVLGTGQQNGAHRGGLGGTARHLAERFPGSALLVPSDISTDRTAKNRIVVTVDGSSHANAALRVAGQIAQTRSAELVVLHAVPDIVNLYEEFQEPLDEAFIEELKRRINRLADKRLERLRRLIPSDKVKCRTRRLGGEDRRRALMRALSEEHGALVVISARGLGADPDMALGSTAEYLLSRTNAPILMVRQAESCSDHASPAAPRRPTATMSQRQ